MLGATVDEGYEAYCLADPVFYDAPTRTRGDDVDFAAALRPVPDGWQRASLDDWLVYRPARDDFPLQGWKIHVSACLDNADEILSEVLEYCISRSIPFKFIRSRQLLLLRNGKYADRGGSGKFVTIYPSSEIELEVVLRELGALLEGRRGPYILSDLRWGQGPLYVRYGGFAERYCVGSNGQLELAIADETGALVPDSRGPTFSPPPWAVLPECLVPHLEARNKTTVQDLPYRIEAALHFSNGGGVYSGVDERSGEEVVLKEARPHAGLATDGADAVERLHRERTILQRLDGLDVVPRFRDEFTLGEHYFLVEEFVEGTPLNTRIVERYPLIAHDVDEAIIADYTEWALDVYGRVERAVEAVHARNVVIGDIHPSNVLVRPDGSVVLIDFEVAGPVEEGRRPTLADPAFLAPADRTGFDIDLYALACLRLYIFLPLTNLLILEPTKAKQLGIEVVERFSVPVEFVSHAVRTILGSGRDAHGSPVGTPGPSQRIEPDEPGWAQARQSMIEAILASATPHRDDRLFPGDPKQFVAGGLNIAYGAAGVLYALDATGSGRHPAYEEWLAERATHPGPGTRLGFFDGLHGVAYVLETLGRRSDAVKVLQICADDIGARWESLGLDLMGGLAGIGLNLTHFAAITGDPSLSDAAWQVADAVAGRLGDEGGVADVSGGNQPYAGLFRGSSGPALLFLRLYEQTGDGALLDLAATALRQDLRRCTYRDDGTLDVNEGWRTMPYLCDGSVGIGMVLADYLAHRDDEAFARAAAAIRRAAEAQFYIEPGLFYGRAGMILYLSRGREPGTGAEDPVVASHVRRLNWHALTFKGRLAFPGEQLLRLSMDLATGTAGILLAMGAALHDAPVHLPLLGPVPTDPESVGPNVL